MNFDIEIAERYGIVQLNGKRSRNLSITYQRCDDDCEMNEKYQKQPVHTERDWPDVFHLKYT